MILNSPYISGSLTVTGNIVASGSVTISGSIASASYAFTSSYAINAETLDGLDSTVFVLTGSYNADSSSFNARTANLESTASILTAASGTLDTRVGRLESTASILTAASASLDAGLKNVIARTGSFATTGSNVFYGNQTVSASMFVSGSITATGQIVAQTINVQSVTSSVVYSSGSNVFGNDLSNAQVFTGSVLITGSMRTIGTVCATGTGCFGVVCSPTHVGGTFSGTTVYGSTVVCGASICSTGNTCFGGATIIAGCVGIGTSTPTAGKLQVNESATQTVAHFQNNDGTTTLANSFITNFRNSNDGNGRYSLSSWQVQNGIGNDQIGFIGVQSVTGASNYTPNLIFGLKTAISSYTTYLTICSTGAACFACELTAKTLGTNDLILNNLNYECANYVDGTRGSWLIQEGACDLFIINQVSGKKYKFNLIEIK